MNLVKNYKYKIVSQRKLSTENENEMLTNFSGFSQQKSLGKKIGLSL